MEAPSGDPQPTMSQKISLLGETKKPLFIAICVLLTLIFFAIIFCIVYFLILKPNQQSSETDQEAEKAAV